MFGDWYESGGKIGIKDVTKLTFPTRSMKSKIMRHVYVSLDKKVNVVNHIKY